MMVITQIAGGIYYERSALSQGRVKNWRKSGAYTQYVSILRQFLMKTIPGFHPSGALRALKFSPKRIFHARLAKDGRSYQVPGELLNDE